MDEEKKAWLPKEPTDEMLQALVASMLGPATRNLALVRYHRLRKVINEPKIKTTTWHSFTYTSVDGPPFTIWGDNKEELEDIRKGMIECGLETFPIQSVEIKTKETV